MKFKPMKTSEHSAFSLHTDWEIVTDKQEKVLIRCTCHADKDNPFSKERDVRWVKAEQIII